MIYAIGDIHGMYVKLTRMYQKIMYHMEKNGITNATIVFLGDYIDRGPHPHKVLDFLMNLTDTDNVKHVFLKGNHEEMFVEAYKGNGHQVWVPNGGRETLNALKIGYPEEFVGNEKVKHYVEWCDNLKTMYVDGKYVFAHAGYDTRKGVDEQNDAVLLWKRVTPYMEGREYDNCEYTIVHGHTPHRDPQMFRNEINVDTFAYYDGPLTAVAIPEDIVEYTVEEIYAMTEEQFERMVEKDIQFLTAQ